MLKDQLDMSMSLITINLVVRNGQKYLRHCLDSIKKQTYQNIEVNIWDNASTDSTREIVKKEYPEFNLIENDTNFGTWVGQEKALKYSHGEYILAISVDIILDPKFIEESVKVAEKDHKIGAVQAKIYQYSLTEFETSKNLPAKLIDTCGFKIFKSRRLINIGHGEEDRGQYDNEVEIFGVEGAVPFFRRKTVDDLYIGSEFADSDFFWYGDDLDIAWRMKLLGWKQIYSPGVIAHHDRQTTKGLGKSRTDFIKMRRQIPMIKRRLDWRNTTLAIIKNDYLSNFLRDYPYIGWRQFQLWSYFLIYEPSMIFEIFTIAKLLPSMLKKRREVMCKARVSAKEIHKWFR